MKLFAEKEKKLRYERFSSMHDVMRFVSDTYGDGILYKYFEEKDLKELSFRDYYKLFMNFGTGLNAHGLMGKRFAIVGESRPEWMCAYLAVVAGGGCIVPLDKELMPEQICSFIDYACCDGVIYTDSLYHKVESANPSVVFINLDDNPVSGENGYTFRRLCADGEAEYESGNRIFADCRPDISSLASIVFTSGTTGTSKGVMLSHNNILSAVHASVNEVDFYPGETDISVLPLHHTYECICGNISAMVCGVTICFNNSLKYFVKNLGIFKPTGLVLVPLFVNTLYKRITDEINKKNKQTTLSVGMFVTGAARKVGLDLRRRMFKEIIDSLGGNVKKIVCGGAAMNPDVIKWFDSIGIKIEQGYGITECAPLVSVNPSATHKPGSVGKPVLDSSVKIIIENDYGVSYEAEPGETGEICVKGPHVMMGYYNAPEETKAAFTGDGYFRTGDYGYLDKDGYIFINGRKKNVIVLQSGKNVYPEEIEEYLDNIDIIKECAVIGRENGDDVVLTAVIFPDYSRFEGKTEEEISAAVKDSIMEVNRRLPIFKQIRGIEIKRAEFEKTTTKKIIRSKI